VKGTSGHYSQLSVVEKFMNVISQQMSQERATSVISSGGVVYGTVKDI